ncbi:cation channel sperm-associated auxiliary subunit epsilon-like isoform X4 [Onychostoma macrolepis]|uniref:cation channel sperm-associated auxiliary subunit epsilon-like isoform X4 n=1 Tax=Onychostoma macrolepis TaxID=369639 RepID=UPI00272AB9FC|nr:cation channel sperm-associated auxiliary subunit epsilon-like isoform X4 [Onychostoma macrolepis]
MLGFGVVFTYILFLYFQTVVGIWRYKQILEDKELFIVDSTIFLEYEGSSFLEWQYPDGCDVNDKRSPHAVMWCKSPGFQAVKPLISDVSTEKEEERHLYISDSFFRLAWYAVIPLLRNSPEHDPQTVRIWIIDPDRADEAVIKNTAMIPSVYFRYLTKSLFIGGEFAVIELSSFPQTSWSYFTNMGVWEARILGVHEYHHFHMTSQSVSFLGNSVASSQHVFYRTSSEKAHGDEKVSLRLPTGSRMSIVWGACTPHRALLLSDKGTFITKNAFLTYEEIKVDPGELLMPTEGYYLVFDAVLLENGLIFRIGDALFWRDNEEGILRRNPMKLLGEGVKGLSFRTQCADYYPLLGFELATVLAWTDHELYKGGKALDWKTNSNYMSNVLSLPKTTTILTAAFGSQPACLGALVMYTDSVQLSLLTSCETEGIWRTRNILSTNVLQGPFQMLFVSAALETLLVWNKDSMLYSFHNDSEWRYLQIMDSSNLSQEASGSHIHHVVMDHSRNMLVKMENNVLFFCKFGMNKLFRLPTWNDPGRSVVLYLNQKGQIIMLTMLDGGLHVQKYPLQMEIRSAMRGEVHSCPFIGFTHNMNRPVYYIDKEEAIEFWAQIVYHEGKNINVMLSRNKDHVLQITERTHFESVRHLDTTNKTFTIYQDADYRDMTNNSDLIIKNSRNSSDIVTMELLPTQIDNSCNLPKNQISHFFVGCPLNRHIRVIKPQRIPCKMHVFDSYTIPGFVLSNSSKDLTVLYDWKSFGCVLRIHYKDEFRPDIDLYDGETFVHSVDANFIVWENFNREDYYFNATMHQVGCLHEAQTWKSMLVDEKRPEEAWGPHLL